MKKYKLLLLAGLSVTVLVFLQAFMLPFNEWAETVATYDQSPPQVEHIWIQKLEEPLETGENIVMRIEYFADEEEIPPTLDIYYGEDVSGHPLYITFHDDGTEGDAEEADYIYTAYINEDIESLVEQMDEAITLLNENEGYTKYTGHVGEKVSESFSTTLISEFNNGVSIELPFAFGLLSQCATKLLKQNSLFITDLAVVENGARTYNVHMDTGNYQGVWTFGNLVNNIVNTGHTGVTAKVFLREWLEHFTDTIMINSRQVNARERVITHLIEPWLRKCYANINSGTPVDISNWQSKWNHDSISTTELLRYAPFKLTAIVNRLDLRANSAYHPHYVDAGETRFIFSLIDPFTGTVPIHDDQPRTLIEDTTYSFVDWMGMNVIFEYHNILPRRCELRDFARKWLFLSNYSTSSTTYLEQLEDLTRMVIDSGALPSGVNRSAIASIRTNEKVLQKRPALTGQQSAAALHRAWRQTNWELRQFELNRANGHLVQVPVFNTPNADANLATLDQNTPALTIGYGATVYTNLSNWIYANQNMVLAEKHIIPTTYLDGAAHQDGEFVHYFNLNNSTITNYRAIRRKHSLNTCQGCHGGETKTLFTHIRPMGYGEAANYWRSASAGGPDRVQGFVEPDFPNENTWETYEQTTSSYVENHPKPTGRRYWQNVSAFLTGRSFSGPVGSGTYQDDLIQTGDDQVDTAMTGDFYVNDPVNGQDNTAPYLRFGYNDLKRRQDDLCILANTACRPAVISLNILKAVTRVPMKEGAH